MNRRELLKMMGLGVLPLGSTPSTDSPLEGRLVSFYPPLNPDGSWQAPWVQVTPHNKHLPAITLRLYPSLCADLDVFASDHYDNGSGDLEANHLVTMHVVPRNDNGGSNVWAVLPS